MSTTGTIPAGAALRLIDLIALNDHGIASRVLAKARMLLIMLRAPKRLVEWRFGF